MKNILLHQILADGSSLSFKEFIPFCDASLNFPQILTIYEDGNLLWKPIELDFNIIVNSRLRDTNIYYVNGRLGIGRYPLYNYVLDVAIPKNTLMTAIHVGDGSFGFSLGNGTINGFTPEILGIGNTENDAGLYFIGMAGNDISSDIPLIIFDGRNTYNKKITNRPIWGITSGNYNQYLVLLDASINLNVKGNITANDIIINEDSLVSRLNYLQSQIDNLKKT